MFNRPDPSYHGLVYTDRYGEAAYIGRCRRVCQRTPAPFCGSPQCIPTATGSRNPCVARGASRCKRPKRIAGFLHDHPRVEWVNYAGFADNPHSSTRPQISVPAEACSLMTFGSKGGFEAAKKFLTR